MYNRKLNLSPALTKALAEYEWPGNVREVQNVDRDDLADIEDLPGYLRETLSANLEPISAFGTEQEHILFIKQIDKKGLKGLAVELLRQLKSASGAKRGLGRGALALMLEARGITVPHYKIRNCLSLLGKKNYLDVGVTKQGAMINARGIELLHCLEGQ